MAERFYYDYADAEPEEIKDRAQTLAQKTDKVHVVFNNSSLDFAPRAAERLRRKLGQIQEQKVGWPTQSKQGTLL